MKKTYYLLIIFGIAVITILMARFFPVFTQEESGNVGDNINSVSVNNSNNTLAFPVRSQSFRGIIITDALLNEMNRITTLDYPVNCQYSRDGSILFVTIWEPPSSLPGHEFDESGKLGIMDTSDWTIDYCNLPSYPVDMYITHDLEFVYVTCGVYVENYSKSRLVKIDISNAQIVSIIEFGKPESGGLILNSIESKIYADSNQLKLEYPPGDDGEDFTPVPGRSIIKVFDADDMHELGEIYIDPDISDLINGPDNIIFVAQRATLSDDDQTDASITVISTINDTVLNEVKINNTSCVELIYDNVNGYIYASSMVLTDYYDENNYSHTDWLPTNKVIRVLISDYSYTWIEVATEPVIPIALSPDKTRLYAGAVNQDSQKIYYKDL